jgi:hypothetical protein
MIKQRIQLRSISNVAASKTALIEVPVGLRYHYIVLHHGYAAGTNTIAAAATNVSEIRVKVNTAIQRTMSGTQLRDMNILNGTAFDCLGLPNTSPGVSFPIYFAEPWRRDEVDQDALAWPSNGWSSFQIEVDLGAASTPTLIGSAVVDSLTTNAGNRGIVKWLRQGIPAAGTSFDYVTLDGRDFLQQISLYPDSGGSNAATQVTFRVDGVTLHELTNAQNTALLTNYEMTPAASGRTGSIYDMVLDHDDLLGSAVNMNGTKSRTLTIAAGGAQSGTVTAIIQRLGPPE